MLCNIFWAIFAIVRTTIFQFVRSLNGIFWTFSDRDRSLESVIFLYYFLTCGKWIETKRYSPIKVNIINYRIMGRSHFYRRDRSSVVSVTQGVRKLSAAWNVQRIIGDRVLKKRSREKSDLNQRSQLESTRNLHLEQFWTIQKFPRQRWKRLRKDWD